MVEIENEAAYNAQFNRRELNIYDIEYRMIA